MIETGTPRRLVLVGGGHAHVHVLEGFADDPPPGVRLTLVVDTPVAMYSGMVPGFVAGQYRREELEIDVDALARRAGADVVVARAVAVDPRRRRIALADAPPVDYDVASFDIGSTVAGLDLPGVREHALPTRPIGRFTERFGSLLEAARARGGAEPWRVVVVGGGSGGVELAFTMHRRLGAETGGAVEVRLLEGGPRILAGYPESLVGRVERLAARRGIEIRRRCRVAAAGPDTVTLGDGRELPCDVLVWVTGAVGQPIFGESGLPTDDRDFLLVRSTLQAPGADGLFAAGDCATLVEHPDTPKAGVYAVRQGPLLTANLRAALAGGPLRSYRPQADFLTLLNVGDGTALGAKWGLSFRGRWVMWVKDAIDRRFMRRFQVRAT